MSDINKVILIGRLTRDPELISTNTGKYLCKFTIASNKISKQKEIVGFFDCIALGKLAEIISKYIQKGRRIAIEGSLNFSSWENNEGKKQSKIETLVSNFQFLDKKEDSDYVKEEFNGTKTEEPFSDEINW